MTISVLFAVCFSLLGKTARSNCSVAKETTAKLGLLLVGFCDMKKGGQKMQRESRIFIIVHASQSFQSLLLLLFCQAFVAYPDDQ